MEVYSEIKAAYHELYNEYAKRKYGESFGNLEIEQ